MKRFLFVVAALSILAISSQTHAGPKDEDWNKVVDKSIEFLKSSQNANGSWGQEPRSRGVSGVVVTGLLQTGKVGADDAPAASGLKYIESLVNVKAGHIAGPEATVQLQNYVTSINVMA